MIKTTCPKMTAAIERILCAHDLLQEFLKGCDFAVRIVNEPYMPLTIERHGSKVTITHYFTQNGDMIPDPDMEFEVVSEHIWRPVAMQLFFGGYHQPVFIRDGKYFVNPKEMKGQIQFASLWARNLIDQGFESGNAERIS